MKGMEKVLATVSGYTGAERHNLIKLISRSGASYVGNMNRSVTHLVCWKFEGPKYELAKRLKIVIVNHCWIEECIKEGRHVSEEPYTCKSGKEVGPLSPEIQLGITETIVPSTAQKKFKEPVICVDDSEDSDSADRTDPINFSEDLFAKPRQNRRVFTNTLIRKPSKRTLRKSHPSIDRNFHEPALEPIIMELEEPPTFQPTNLRRLGKRNTTLPQTHSRRRFKRSTRLEDFGFTSNVNVDILTENPSSSDVRNSRKSDSIPFMSRHNYEITLDDVEEIEEFDDECQIESVYGASSSSSTLRNPQEHSEAKNDLLDTNHHDRPPPSELSCVICWTDFSSTRGVLPCGHRFCFSCIQNWADHMASRKKPSTCPLCKANFICITKVEDALSSDQKIYSQTLPGEYLNSNLYILPDETCPRTLDPATQVCFRCFSKEPADLLMKCHCCHIRCVHTFCLDPPLFPWTCVHCKDLRLLYTHTR